MLKIDYTLVDWRKSDWELARALKRTRQHIRNMRKKFGPPLKETKKGKVLSVSTAALGCPKVDAGLKEKPPSTEGG